jgi:hypothetical protein
MRQLFSYNSIENSVADPHQSDPALHFDADPDPTFQFDADADPDPTSHFPPVFDLPMLQNKPLRLPTFYFAADPDPDFHFDADPDSDAQHCPKKVGSGKSF